MRWFPPFFFPVMIGGSAGYGVVDSLLHRKWFVALECACVLPIAVAWVRALPEPTDTFATVPAALFTPPVCSPGCSHS